MEALSLDLRERVLAACDEGDLTRQEVADDFVVSRSFENLSGTKIILARNLNIRDLFTHTYLLLAKDCLELLEENFGKPTRPKGIAPDPTEHEHDQQEAE